MLDLKLIDQINEVEAKTGQNFVTLVSKVPFMTVVTAFQHIQIPDLVDMVTSVPITKLVHGLNIISIEEIQKVPVDKLKIVLSYGNMHTVEKLQREFGSTAIIRALSKLDSTQISNLLKEYNYAVISNVINQVAYV